MASLESIETLLKEFKHNTETHLETLNGKVAANTGFRLKAMGGFAVLGFIGVGTLIGVVTIWLKYLGS